jgi:hypothetical protein
VKRRHKVLLGVAAAIIALFAFGLVGLLTVHPAKHPARPSTSRVEENVRIQAQQRGRRVTTVSCSEDILDHWQCHLTLAQGRTATGTAEWHPKGRVLGVAVKFE